MDFSKRLEKIVGYLVWASYAEPFGWPFISAISIYISRGSPRRRIRICGDIETAIKIWITILERNEGISFSYILNEMAYADDEWFVDASTTWGIGGLASTNYFLVPNEDLKELYALVENAPKTDYPPLRRSGLPIAYIELIAALAALSVFSHLNRNQLILLNSDNTDVVAWLRKGRCSKGIGFKLLAGIEYFKRVHSLKLSPKHIPGRFNNSADSLSRGIVPGWLDTHGTCMPVSVGMLCSILRSPLGFWFTR